MKAPDATGQIFGRLTITGLSHVDSHRFWVVRCRCACGSSYTVRFASLRSGRSRSCGCLRRETARENATSRPSTPREDHRTSDSLKSSMMPTSVSGDLIGPGAAPPHIGNKSGA